MPVSNRRPPREQSRAEIDEVQGNTQIIEMHIDLKESRELNERPERLLDHLRLYNAAYQG